MARSRPAPEEAAAKEEPLLTEESESEEASEDSTESEAEETEPESAPAAPPAPRPAFKFSTFILVFLFILGFWMLIDTSARNAVAMAFNVVLFPLIGFQYQYLLVTMFLAAAIEMAITAVAYNYTTDWVKAAKVQSWGTAFRKVQMKAIRSGKKDRMDALKVHQTKLTKLSSEVSIAQMKGMAVTWFLLIVLYSWVGITISAAPANLQVVSLGAAQINLLWHVGTQSTSGGLPIPYWFLLFSVYTVPMSIIFRRLLKNYSLRQHPSGVRPAAETEAAQAALPGH